ncbi:MAG TPA: ATP-grasp domain-containing protein, partial [Thermoanaerobaculia bacterium]
SDGVSRVDRVEQIETALELTGNARAFGGVICEEFVEGPEVSVEGYVVDGEFVGVAITDKLTDERFLEIGHSQPTRLPRAAQEQVFEATARVLRGLGVTSGLTHTEMRLSERGPVLIETHTRMGGGSIHLLTRTTTGVDLAEVLVASALGEKPAMRPAGTGTAAAIRFITGPAGTVTKVELPEIDPANGIVDVRSNVKAGDETTGRSSSLDRFGFVIATGADRDESDRRADEARSRFRVTVREKNMKKRALFVGGANLAPVREAAERRGYEIVAVNYAEAIERMDNFPSVIHAEAMNFKNTMAAQRRMVELHKQFGFSAIVPVSEYGLHAASMAARTLGLPYTPMEAVVNTRDKARMRKVLEAKGLAQVQYRSCTTLEQVREFFAQVGGPIIVKPLLGTGSDGVSRVDSDDELEGAWRTCGGARSFFGGAICEEFVDGPEVSVEAYLVDGQFVPVAITDKHTDERFLEIGHSQPTQLSPELQQQIFDKTRELLLALGVTHGVTHTEMRISKRGPVLIETHTRMGGDFISTLIQETTGVDLGDVLVACAFGETPAQHPRDMQRGCTIRFLTGPAGVVTSIDVPEAANGVKEARAYIKVGDETTGRSASLDRFGHVIAVGNSRNEADRIAEEALSRFQVTLADRQAVAS